MIDSKILIGGFLFFVAVVLNSTYHFIKPFDFSGVGPWLSVNWWWLLVAVLVVGGAWLWLNRKFLLVREIAPFEVVVRKSLWDNGTPFYQHKFSMLQFFYELDSIRTVEASSIRSGWIGLYKRVVRGLPAALFHPVMVVAVHASTVQEPGGDRVRFIGSLRDFLSGSSTYDWGQAFWKMQGADEKERLYKLIEEYAEEEGLTPEDVKALTGFEPKEPMKRA